MSNFENDKIIESAFERSIEEGLDEFIFDELDLEDKFNYLMTGKIPETYHQLWYRAYKS